MTEGRPVGAHVTQKRVDNVRCYDVGVRSIREESRTSASSWRLTSRERFVDSEPSADAANTFKPIHGDVDYPPDDSRYAASSSPKEHPPPSSTSHQDPKHLARPSLIMPFSDDEGAPETSEQIDVSLGLIRGHQS